MNANRSSFLIYRPNFSTKVPYRPKATTMFLCHRGQGLRLTLHDCMFCTQLVPPTCLGRHHMSMNVLKPTGHTNFTRVGWAALWACLEDKLPGNPGIRQVRWGAASAPWRRQHTDPRPPLPASILDAKFLKCRLSRQWHVTTYTTLKSQVNRLQMSGTFRLKEWMNDQWIETLVSLCSEDQ